MPICSNTGFLIFIFSLLFDAFFTGGDVLLFLAYEQSSSLFPFEIGRFQRASTWCNDPKRNLFRKSDGVFSGAADNNLDEDFEGLVINVGTVEGPLKVNFNNVAKGNFNGDFGSDFDVGAFKAWMPTCSNTNFLLFIFSLFFGAFFNGGDILLFLADKRYSSPLLKLEDFDARRPNVMIWKGICSKKPTVFPVAQRIVS